MGSGKFRPGSRRVTACHPVFEHEFLHSPLSADPEHSLLIIWWVNSWSAKSSSGIAAAAAQTRVAYSPTVSIHAVGPIAVAVDERHDHHQPLR